MNARILAAAAVAAATLAATPLAANQPWSRGSAVEVSQSQTTQRTPWWARSTRQRPDIKITRGSQQFRQVQNSRAASIFRRIQEESRSDRGDD